MLGTEGELGDVLRAAVLVHHDDVVLPVHRVRRTRDTTRGRFSLHVAYWHV